MMPAFPPAIRNLRLCELRATTPVNFTLNKRSELVPSQEPSLSNSWEPGCAGRWLRFVHRPMNRAPTEKPIHISRGSLAVPGDGSGSAIAR